MSEKFYWNDFSAGWCPSDDPLNARPNALLRMENVELDSNGALQMSGGTTRLGSAFSNTAHTIYQKYINGTSYLYSTDTSGGTFRNNTSIKTGGSATRSAFNAAYNYVFGFSDTKRFRDDGSATVDLGVIKPSAAPTVGTAVIGSPAVLLTGDYEYCQVNVFKNGTYQAKSARGAIGTVSPVNQNIAITPQDPATPGSNATEAWIFRRGVNLDTWYRIAVRTSYGSFGDTVSDSDALLLGITLNDYLLSVNSTDTPDAIIACVGPIYGRMIYCTAKQVIPSDRYSPDSYDSRTVMGLGGASGAETFKWAIKVGKNTVLIGTDLDVYILSGTWVQLPDGFLDVSLDPLSISDPPIGIDVALYQNSAVYMSKSGWVACSVNGNIVNLCFPNTDLVYKGIATQECGAVTIDATGTTRYSCAIVRNKLYCIVPVGAPVVSGGSSSIHTEVYDFLRKYWRVAYVGISPKMFVGTELGTVIGFDNTDKFIKTYDAVARTLDDGSSTRQTIAITSKCYDLDTPNVRKDLFTLVVIGGTGSSVNGIVPSINVDGRNPAIDTGNITFTAFKISDTTYGFQSTYTYDVASASGSPLTILPTKSFQFKLNGTPTDLRFKGFCLVYSNRPPQQTYLRLDNLGLDSITKKRVRGINFIIDTLGSDVVFTPTVDGTAHSTTTFNTTRKAAVTHQFFQDSDSFGVDFSGILQSGNNIPFEFYEMLPPEVTYVLPQSKIYNTIGEVEIFKYGKIKEIEFRLATLSVGTIPYTIYCDNVSVNTGSITPSGDVENIYRVVMPKTVGGNLLKIDLGPLTAGTFRHISTRIQFVKSGNETEESWVTLEGKTII